MQCVFINKYNIRCNKNGNNSLLCDYHSHNYIHESKLNDVIICEEIKEWLNIFEEKYQTYLERNFIVPFLNKKVDGKCFFKGNHCLIRYHSNYHCGFVVEKFDQYYPNVRCYTYREIFEHTIKEDLDFLKEGYRLIVKWRENDSIYKEYLFLLNDLKIKYNIKYNIWYRPYLGFFYELYTSN